MSKKIFTKEGTKTRKEGKISFSLKKIKFIDNINREKNKKRENGLDQNIMAATEGPRICCGIGNKEISSSPLHDPIIQSFSSKDETETPPPLIMRRPAAVLPPLGG